MSFIDPLEWLALAPFGAGDPEPEPEPEPAPGPVPGAAPALPGPGTWLLDLVIGGREFRYAPRRLEVLDVAGRRYLYRSGLSDFEMRLDGLEERQGFQVQDRAVDWSAIAARGEGMHRATATLRHLSPGQVLEAALVTLSGVAEEIEHGDPSNMAAIVGTVLGEARDIAWPDPRARVSRDTWTFDLDADAYDIAVEDAAYPIVFGYPGEESGFGAEYTATPALLVKHYGSSVLATATFVVCDGFCDAASVLLFGPDTQGFDEREVFPVVQEADQLGRVVSVIKVPFTGGDVEPKAGSEYYVAWSRESGRGGGSRRPGRPGPIRELVDVALFALRGSGRRVDLLAQESQRDALASFLVDGFIGDDLFLIPWFEQTLLPIFPLVRARTSRGMYWRFVDWSAGPEAAEVHIDTSEGRFHRETSLRTQTGSIRNVLRIDYRYSLRAGSFSDRRVLSAESGKVLPWYENPDHVDDLRTVGSAVLARSQATYDPIEALPIQSKFVSDDATAIAILRSIATRDAFPRQSVIYSGDARELRGLSRGSVVTVTDPQVRLDRAVGIVQSLNLSSSRTAELALELTDPRARST